MARVITKESVIQKIEKAQADVEKKKKAYEDAAAELTKLQEQLEEIKRAELMEAILKSGKSLDDVFAFLNT